MVFCFPPVVPGGVICSAAKRFLSLQEAPGGSRVSCYFWEQPFAKHGSSGLLALDLGRERRGRKEVRQDMLCSFCNS